MNDNSSRVGIFGGTFNPIHNGHLMIARSALEQFSLEQVLFIPTGQTLYKEYAGENMRQHRFRMVELAIRDDPSFFISRDEIDSGYVNYTYQTLEKMRADHPEKELFFILGGDSLRDFPTWKHPERICQNAVILAAAREEIVDSKMDRLIRQMSADYHGEFYRLDTPPLDISSKDIRSRVKRGEDIRGMVPSSVADYIYEKGLYRD